MARILCGVVFLVVVFSCGLPGAPIAGSKCDPAIDQPECITATSLGTCGSDGKWVASSCDRCSNNQEIVCTHHAGESCTGSDGYCSSSTTLLQCQDGKYVEWQCNPCSKTDGALYVCY